MDKLQSSAKPGLSSIQDEPFQRLLLALSAAAADGDDFVSLVQLFLRLTREFFAVDGAFCWQRAGDELIALMGDGLYAERFAGCRLKMSDRAVAVDAIRSRKTKFENGLRSRAEVNFNNRFPADSVLAAPLAASGQVVGAVVFIRAAAGKPFDEDSAEKATILASQLGLFIEASRLTRASREERRRAEVLVQCAQSLHSVLDAEAIRAELTQKVCELLRARLVVLLAREGEALVLRSVVAEDATLAEAVRAQHAKGGCKFAESLAEMATGSEQPLIVSLADANLSDVPEPLATGQMLIAQLRGANSECALLVYCGPEHVFDVQELSLVRAIAGFGVMALNNAELFAKTHEQAREVQQLLDISSELGSIGQLDKFLERFVIRAVEFLGFERSFIALVEGKHCHVRWVAEKGTARPMVVEVPEVLQQHVLVTKETFWADDAAHVKVADAGFLARFELKQGIAAPLLGSDGRALGILGVLDRRDGRGVSPEDIRRAKALAAEVAVVLEATQNLHLSKQHQGRAENLMSLALEMSSSIQMPELVQSFTHRAADMLGAPAAALALMRGSVLETVCLHNTQSSGDKSLVRRLNLALTDVAAHQKRDISSGSASEVLGRTLAEGLGWRDVVVARLTSAEGDLIGVLCIANRPGELEKADRNLLQALAGHASVALENSRLFTRIAQSNSQWLEIFDAISDFIVVHDQGNRVLRINRSMAEFIGVRPPELIGVSMRALMELAQETGPEPCPFCRSEGSSDEFIHPVLERTYLVSTSTIRGALDDGKQTIHVLKDISDRREAERRYRELFDNIQEGLFFSTPDGRFIEVNDALVRMIGYDSREELLQVDIANQLYLSPDQRLMFRQAIEAAGTLRNFQETLRRKDGSIIYTLQNAFAVRDAQGSIVQYRGLMLDITELKTFQAELQRQRDFNEKILNNTQSVIVVADTAGLISYANRRCYEGGGYTAGELVGRPLVELVAPVRRQAALDALAQTLEGLQVDNLDLPISQSHGEISHFSVNLSPMRDEQGQVTSIVVVMTDITDAAILQAKLMHTEKMAAVGQLVSGVAHEVNNPLTAILGFADLLAGQPDMSDAAKQDLSVIIQEAQRTKLIVQNLLSFARQMPPQREPVQVNSILHKTLRLRAYDFANHGVEVSERIESPMPDIVGDSHQLQQVFLNILNNAYDAVRDTGRPGRIEIGTRTNEGFAEVTFSDNGEGIAAPDRIFDPFFTTKEVGKGTGLGLSICYGIVREHGGEITCRNRLDGAGATFTVRLPLAIRAMSAGRAQ